MVRKRPLLEFENPGIDALPVAVVEATKEAAINDLCATCTIKSLDGHLAEVLPVDAILATLQRYGLDIAKDLL